MSRRPLSRLRATCAAVGATFAGAAFVLGVAAMWSHGDLTDRLAGTAFIFGLVGAVLCLTAFDDWGDDA